MVGSNELELVGCTIRFVLHGWRESYLHFDLEFQFVDRSVQFPAVRGAMSPADVRRLSQHLAEALIGDARSVDVFVAYDSFFQLECLEGDVVRFRAAIASNPSLWLGVQGSASDSSLEAFRETWEQCLLGH